MAQRLTRWVGGFDLHGDGADKDTVAMFRSFCDDFKPTIRIKGGDCFDLRWLRRSASDDEKLACVEADFEAGIDFLSWFKPTVFLRGNHDERLWDCAQHHTQGAMRSLASHWIERVENVTGKGCKHYPYNKRTGVHQLGDLRVTHGYAHGIGSLRKQAMVYGNVLVGHVHRVEMVRVERFDPAWGYSSGCLCTLDFDYARANIGTLAQENGWAYGVVTPEGSTVVWLARKVGGKWILPSDLTLR